MRVVTHSVVALVLLAFWQFARSETVPAANGGSAVYTDGVFTLPEQIEAKQRYILVIQIAEEKDREIQVPDGSNMFRLIPSARPVGKWSWTYRLRPIEGKVEIV